MTIVAPFGFYGWGNIGDESTLQGFARLVARRRPVPTAWVASRNPLHTRRVEPTFRYYRADRPGLRRRWALHRATATVFPGGTPIMDGLGSWPLDEVSSLIAAAHERATPIVFVGTGTERLERPESRRILAGEIANKVTFWTVRSERDQERLEAGGVPRDRITVAADLAWLLDPVTTDFGRRVLHALQVGADERLIGVNVNSEAAMLRREPQLVQTLAALLDGLVEASGGRIVFLCSEIREDDQFDRATSQRVVALMRRPDRTIMVPNRYWAPQELLSLVACCQLMISTRYHVCLFSALQRVPFLALQRSDKVRDICSDIGWPFGVPLGELHVPTLLDCAVSIGEGRATLQRRLGDAALQQRERSLKNQVALDVLNGTVRS
jgi:polysaccharide pyruvyl transferase WcaK-like protein